MMLNYIFPIIMIILNLLQGIIMAVDGDFVKMTYWIAAAVLNLTVAIK